MRNGVDGEPKVINFPGWDRPRKSDVELVHSGAPPRALVEALLLGEGLESRNVTGGLAAEIDYVLRCFEQGYGNDATVARYRELVDAETARAAELIRNFDATADALMVLEGVVARSERVSGSDMARLRQLRERFRGQAIAARAAADAAIAATTAMVGFVRGGSSTTTIAAEPRQMQLFATG